MMSPARLLTGLARELEKLEERLDGEPHEILGVRANATNSEACDAFIDLSRQFHPRRFAAGDAQMVRRVAAAYRRLRTALAEFARRDELALVGGRYVLEGKLGEGGMGSVFEARHAELGKKFALKVMNRRLATNRESLAKFNEEAKIASEITHPNIVSVVDYGNDPHVGPYMVMSLLEGDTLADGGKVSIRRACDVLAQIASALDTIHRRGIVHGDIKADNIMLVEEPATQGRRRRQVATLMDFGLAQRMTSGGRRDSFAGTPHYVAPERASGEPATVATDLYALGVLGFYLLTGEHPFEGTQEEILDAHARSEPPAMTDVDPALAALVLRALHKDPAQRQASAAAFLYELDTVMEMLDIGRRRGKRRMQAALPELFTTSPIPQALMSTTGILTDTNAAFGRLLRGRELPSIAPGLLEAAKRAHVEAIAVLCKGALDGHNVLVWLAPVPVRDQLHVLVHVI